MELERQALHKGAWATAARALFTFWAFGLVFGLIIGFCLGFLGGAHA
jgi:hypothetical protein